MSDPRARLVEVRELQGSDEERLLEAFNATNAAQSPCFEPRTSQAWRWKYFANGAGLRSMVGFGERGEVLAQYAGLPQRVWLDGQETRITQGVDSFSVQGARGLGKRGAFVQTGEHFAREYGGVLGAGDPWMWGLPVRSAQRVGERFLGYQSFRHMPLLELRHEPASGAVDGQAQQVPWKVCMDEAGAFDELFKQERQQFAAIADRRSQALLGRYGPRPEAFHKYKLIVQRSDLGALIGYAIVSVGSIDGQAGAILCDLSCPGESEAPLLRAAWGFACEQGQEVLLASMPPWSSAFARAQDSGFRVRGSSLLMVGRSYDRNYPVDFWASKWWVTLGDTDLC